MEHKIDSFQPRRLKRAIRRLDYINKWIEEEFREKKDIKVYKNTTNKKVGFLEKLLNMLKSRRR